MILFSLFLFCEFLIGR